MDEFAQLIIGFIILVLGLIGAVIYIEYQRPSFELKKDDWQCAKTVTRTTLQFIGKTAVPISTSDCIRYERKGD